MLIENEVLESNVPYHTREIFHPAQLERVADWLVRVVRKEKPDVLVACGFSGVIPATVVAQKLHIPIIGVRKNSEIPVGDTRRLNGYAPHRPFRYVVIDDCVASGGTFETIHANMAEYFPLGTCVALALYSTIIYSAEHSYTIQSVRDTIGKKIGEQRASTIKIIGRPSEDLK